MRNTSTAQHAQLFANQSNNIFYNVQLYSYLRFQNKQVGLAWRQCSVAKQLSNKQRWPWSKAHALCLLSGRKKIRFDVRLIDNGTSLTSGNC